jgi:antibiotic biosynthesis monooxygenase (ABM) superfamily enzyme
MNLSDRGVQPATVVFTWDVTPGREAEFESWAHGVNETATTFPGHLGVTWLRAEGSRQRYYTILNFVDEDRLNAWMNSQERDEWRRRLDGTAKEHRHHTTGMETWFSLPGNAVPAPARPKMVLVTLLAVYPLSLLFQGLIAPLTRAWPLALRSLVFPIVVVPALTYALMPGLSRAFRGWLYPAHRTHPPARKSRPRRPAAGPADAARGLEPDGGRVTGGER